MMTRTITAIAILLSPIGCCSEKQETTTTSTNTWDNYQVVVDGIKELSFPDKTFDVMAYGAKGDGTTDDSKAIKDAIEACNKAGGGKVIVPVGNYLSGPIYIKSNVNLHLEKDARIMFSTNPKDYLPLVHTRWEGIEVMNYSPLVYAFEEKNIAITGEGTLDGQASKENWWRWTGSARHGWKAGEPHQKEPHNRPALFQMGEDNVPVEERVFGEGHYLRPQFFQPYRCENVKLEGVTVTNSPMWIIHPVLCNNVIIRNVNVKSGGPNTDGCDPESCKDVLIEGCTFSTGDDCIALKSGRNNDGRRIDKLCENVVIRNCKMTKGHGGIVIGSEITGGARNIFVENCQMDSPALKRAIRIKTNSARGGTIENVYLRKLEVGTVSETLLKINLFYEDGDGHGHTPIVRNVYLEDIHCKSTKYPMFMLGYENSKIQNVQLKNVTIDHARESSVIQNVDNIVMTDVSFQKDAEVNIWGSVEKK